MTAPAVPRGTKDPGYETIEEELKRKKVPRPVASLDDVLLELIDIDDNVRDDPGELEGLAANIAEIGLQSPVKVTRQPDGRYRLVFGQRRVLAFRLLGRLKITAIVEPPSDVDQVGARRSIEQLAENLVRKDLNAIEEAVALREVLDADPTLTQEALADKLGMSRPWVSNTLRLLKADPGIQERVRLGEISASHAKAIAVLPAQQQRELAERVVNHKLSAHDLEREIKWKQDAALQAANMVNKTAKWIPKAIAFLEAERVSKTDGSLIVTGPHYDMDIEGLRKAIAKAGWRSYEGGAYGTDPETNGHCDCQVLELSVGGRKPELRRRCVDRRHVDQKGNDEQLARKAAQELFQVHARQLLEAAAPLVMDIPASIGRPLLFMLERSAGRYMPWEQIAALDQATASSMLLDCVVGVTRWNGVEITTILRQLGVEPAEPAPEPALAKPAKVKKAAAT